MKDDFMIVLSRIPTRRCRRTRLPCVFDLRSVHVRWYGYLRAAVDAGVMTQADAAAVVAAHLK